MKTAARLFLTAFALVLPGIAPAAPTASAPATLIVLDASGSMRERIKGETKMEIAKRAVRELVASLPDEARLGLVVYSHRTRNDCDDIELMIPPAKLDRAAFTAAVNKIQPKGMTPLSAALVFAANALDYRKQPANVILVSDGLETCSGDPCATAAKLKAAGVGLIVHTVAFDLSAKEMRSFACIAAATGGRSLRANDAASLRDALFVVVTEAAVVAPPKPAAPPAAVPIPVTLKVPPAVLAGSVFDAGWTGPDGAGDFLTIVPLGTPDGDDGNVAYTRQGSPLKLTAPPDPGDAEVRYVAGRAHSVLVRAPIKVTAVEASLAAAAEVTAGSLVSITWKGPNNEGDYVTIVPKGTDDGEYAIYTNTREGSPLVVRAPIQTGEAEIRYMSGQVRRVLARRALKLVPAEITLVAPDEVQAGAVVAITWKGPNNENDYITIVSKATPDGRRSAFAYTQVGSPAQVTAPGDAGACEIRYMSGQGDLVLGRRAVTTVTAGITMSAPEEIVAGSEVAITWKGPNNENDYITIVPQGTPDGRRSAFAYTLTGSPLQVAAPGDPGAGEIRYVNGQDDKVLARRAVVIKLAQITLSAPARAPLGAPVTVAWTGPNNQNDFITIVPKGSPDGTSGHFAWTASGSPAMVDPPDAAGSCEVRYISGQGDKVLARIDVEITAAGR